MKKMKIVFLVTVLWISHRVFAQGVTTEQTAEKIDGSVFSGYSTKVLGDYNEVHEEFIKNLKTYGKVKENRKSIHVANPSINGTMFQEKSIHALAKKTNDQTYLWIGIKTEDWESTSLELVNSQMDKILKDFVLSYYRGHVQKKIDETQSVWTSIEKLQSKTVKQESDLNRKLEYNIKEKSRLDQAIIDNEKENVSLKSRIEGNKRAQDSLANVLQQVKKKMAAHQEELRKIN